MMKPSGGVMKKLFSPENMKKSKKSHSEDKKMNNKNKGPFGKAAAKNI